MSVGHFLPTTHDIDLVEKPNGKVYGWRGSDLIGAVWLAGVLGWSVRRVGDQADTRVQSRHQGLNVLVGGCPDCVCVPMLCASDETGLHCGDMNCGYCLHGCSEDECAVVAR